jgi:hypothetical protein
MFHPEHRPSGEGIKEFKNGLRGMTFVSPDPKFSDLYARDAKDSDFMSGAVYPVHVQVRKPFDFENADHLDVMTDELSKLSGKSPQIPAWINGGSEKIRKQLRSGNWDVIEDPLVIDIAKRLGFDGAYMNEQGVKNLGVFDPKRIKSAVGNRGTYDINDPDITKAKGGRVKEPKNTVKAYKLFRVHEKHPGKLFPLFVDANTPVEMGQWIDAKIGEMAGSKVKSKIGPLAFRPGWHAGDTPVATHIGEKSDPSLTAPDRRPANHVWAEVEMPHDVDWQSVANERGMNAQGKIVPVKAHITDQIPVGGHYRYKTNPNMTGDWLIGGSMRVNKVLTDKEVEKINKAAGLSDLPRAQPMKKKTFGFASGGEVGPDEWKAEAHVNHRPKISRMAGGGSQGFPLRVPADDPSMLSELKDSFNRESKTYGNKGAVMDILNRGPVTDYLGSAADLPNMALQGIDYLQSKIPALSEPESVMDADGKRVPKFPLSSDKPWGGKEAWNEALKKLGVTSDVERPIAETTASLLSPLAPFAAKKAITAAKKLAPTVAEMATELAEKGGAPLRQFAVPNEGKLSKEEYSRMMREKYAAENAAKAAKKEAAPVVQEVKAPADNLGFYSGVEKAALNLQRKAGTGDDFIADLMKNPGVNDARISEMGLDALRGKANVTADEVRQLATKNKPQLSESVRVEPSQTKIAELESEYDDLTRELHDLQGSGNSRAISRVESELERNRLEQRYIKDETPADFGPESKPDYNTPGGRNYREIRVKTPAFTPAMEKRAEEIRNTDLRGWTVKKLTPKPGQVYQNPVQILDTGGNSRGTLDGKFTDEEFLQQYAKNAAERELRDTEVFRENIHHGDEKNVLFHLRVADHTDAQGKKGLLIDELQSDWHQQGKKKGYGPQYQDRYRAYYDTEQGPVDIAFGKTPEQLERMIKASGWDAEPIKIRIEKTADKVSQGVPDAPFKENWYQLGLKRAIKEAADKGMDRVYLTTGKTQNERYALSKQISEVHYTDQNGLYAYDKDGQLVIHEKVSKEKLPDYIGKEASEKLINQPAVGGNKVLDGIDLDVGGEGMKHWYDNQYINYLKKYANEHGSTVGMTRLPAANATKNDLSLNQIDKFLKDPEFAKVLDEEFIKRTGAPRITGKIEPQEGGTYMVQWSDGTFSGGYSQKGAFNKMREGKNKAIDDLRSWNAALARSGGQEVYYLELTPKLKNSAKKGQQYKAGGIVRKAIGGITQGNNMQAPTLAQMRMQLNQRKNPDYIDTIGIEQAVDMDPKRYISPNPMQNNFMPVGGVADSNGLPVGGIDQDNAQQGQQFMAPQPQQQDQDMQPNPSPEGTPPPEQEGTPEQKMGNMLSLTPQGQAMQAMGGAPGQPPRMAAGGKVNPLAKIRAEMKYAKGGSHYPPAPALKQSEIEEMAERIARQTTGLENANEVSQQQTEREKNLPVGITSKKKKHVPIINFEEYKGASTVGVPGDPSRGGVVPSKRKLSSPKAGEYLNSIGGEKLEHSVPMYGGKDYGAYGHDDAWASDLGASAGLFNVVKRLAEENPGTDILGHYHKMTPKSLNHAVHMLDAVLSHHKPHKLHPEQITVLNHLMREVATTKGKHDIPYPEFPGFENPAAVMMHGAYNSGMRKKLIGLLGTEKYFPGGKQKMHDIMYALSHPELRNVETGAGGSSILQFDPSRELKDSISPHPTYDYDIPSKLIGRTRYTTPAKIIAPRSMHNAEREIKAMGKKVVPFNQAKLNIIREPIDEQYINQLGAYEQAMKKRLGYKKGGKVSEKTQKDIMKFNVLSKKAK